MSLLSKPPSEPQHVKLDGGQEWLFYPDLKYAVVFDTTGHTDPAALLAIEKHFQKQGWFIDIRAEGPPEDTRPLSEKEPRLRVGEQG